MGVSLRRLRVSGECDGSVAGYGQIAGVTALGGRGSASRIVVVSPEKARSVPDQRANRAGRLAGWLAGWLKGGNLGEWNSNSGCKTEAEESKSAVR